MLKNIAIYTLGPVLVALGLGWFIGGKLAAKKAEEGARKTA